MTMLESILAKTPWGRSVTAEVARAEAEASKRIETAPRLEDARQRLETEGPPLTKKIEEQTQRIRDMIAAHEVSILRERGELQRLLDAHAALDRACDTLAHAMRLTTPSEVEDMDRELRELDAETRKATRSERGESWEDQGSTFIKKTSAASNRSAVAARREAIRAAREQVEALRFVVLPADELTRRLDTIRSSIPSAATLSKMTEQPPTKGLLGRAARAVGITV